MFEPTKSNEVDIFITTGDNDAQSRSQQETEAKPELQFVEDTYSMPVEHKGTAFLLDSCEEAVALDAVLLVPDDVNMHTSKQIKETIVNVSGLSVENETHTFFKIKLKMKRIFSCFVS